jgi:hypothetical protein
VLIITFRVIIVKSRVMEEEVMAVAVAVAEVGAVGEVTGVIELILSS